MAGLFYGLQQSAAAAMSPNWNTGWRRTIGATAGVVPRSSHYDQEGPVCDWRAAMPPTSRTVVLAQDFLDNTIVTAKALSYAKNPTTSSSEATWQ
jgi:hypothetical protein